MPTSLDGRAQTTGTDIPALLRRGAVTVAAGRVALGAALAPVKSRGMPAPG